MQLPGQAWDGHSDMVIVRLASLIRMVTKDYQRRVYNRVLARFGKRDQVSIPI
jgi:hypothetical protein